MRGSWNGRLRGACFTAGAFTALFLGRAACVLKACSIVPPPAFFACGFPRPCVFPDFPLPCFDAGSPLAAALIFAILNGFGLYLTPPSSREPRSKSLIRSVSVFGAASSSDESE